MVATGVVVAVGRRRRDYAVAFGERAGTTPGEQVGQRQGHARLAMALAVMTGRSFPHLHPTRRGVRVAALDWESTQADIAGRVDATETAP